jgi:general secretion pathway protein A
MLVPLNVNINARVKRAFDAVDVVPERDFSSDIKVDELYHTAALEGMKERFLYAANLGAISVVTGDVGSGKSTALRYASGFLHPSQYQLIPVVASTGSVVEILKQICMALDIEWMSISLAKLIRTIRGAVMGIGKRKQIPVVIIDEASLLRIEVFAQLHTLGWFEMDSKPLLTMITRERVPGQPEQPPR